MAEIKDGYFALKQVQDQYPRIYQALLADIGFNQARKSAIEAEYQTGDFGRGRAGRQAAAAHVDTALISRGDDPAEAKVALRGLARKEREDPYRVTARVALGPSEADEGNVILRADEESTAADIMMERSELATASIFEDASNESVVEAYEKLFGVSPF